MGQSLRKLLLVLVVAANAVGLIVGNTPTNAGVGGPTISVQTAIVGESDGQVFVQVQLSAPAGPGGVEFDYATANGTATAGVDYTATNATDQNIAAGNSSFPVAVPILNDTLDESNETFTLSVSNATGTSNSTAQGTVTINDNDDPNVLAIADPLAPSAENAGTVTFDVTLSRAHNDPVSVSFNVGEVTAIEPEDFTTTSGLVEFATGETSKQIAVQIVDDALDEDTEEFTVSIADPGEAGVTLGQSSATGAIADNDGEPVMTINDVSLKEGKRRRTTDFVFTVSLSNPSGVDTIDVDFETVDGTAIAGSDYVANDGILSFAPGETTKTITVVVRGDRKREKRETFFVELSGATNSTLGDDEGVGTIRNDDKRRRR